LLKGEGKRKQNPSVSLFAKAENKKWGLGIQFLFFINLKKSIASKE
jgi:hypothetical protein